jgi:hypothetical protein
MTSIVWLSKNRHFMAECHATCGPYLKTKQKVLWNFKHSLKITLFAANYDIIVRITLNSIMKSTYDHRERLIDWLLIVLRPTQEYSTYMETSPLPVKGCKI